jgi:predicted ATPase
MALFFSKIEIENWRNFKHAVLPLERRVFLVGPNAVGKSNLLDVFRFLRDLVTEGGGLVSACRARDGVGKIRSVYARSNPDISIAVEVSDANSGERKWRYELSIGNSGTREETPAIRKEVIARFEKDQWRNIRSRPEDADGNDPVRLRQTLIQQTSENKDFRELVEFFSSVHYLHLVPQLVREGQDPVPGTIGPDPFGRDLLDRIRDTKKPTRDARLKRIGDALKLAVEPLEKLDLIVDERGRPHLQALFRHWRPRGTYQDERQFSDGTLRLIGLLWSLQEAGGPLLLEEPELSLHAAFVARLAPFISRAQRRSGSRQVVLSTHSADLLSDEAIGSDEVVLIRPAKKEGSEAVCGADVEEVRSLMHAGLTAAEVVLPRTKPAQADLFDRETV